MHRVFGTSDAYKTRREQADQLNGHKSNNSMTSSQQPCFERKSSVNSSTTTVSTERKSSIGDIGSLSELLRKKKKDARRAEIVAAVTKRLYSARKKVEMKSEPAEMLPEQKSNREQVDAEPDELKLCQRARARLQELSKKALHAQRGRMQHLRDGEAQTDFGLHAKEVAVSTEELYCGPHMFFTDNRRLLFTSYAYPSMRQGPARSSASIRNHNKLPNEDSFSDDSLDSTHETDMTEEQKPSLWNVISISSGKQFKIKRVEKEHDEMFKNISTHIKTCSHQTDNRSLVQNDLDMKPDHFSICSNDMVSPRQADICEHKRINQPTEVANFNELSSCLHKDTQQQADSNMGRCEPSDMDTGIIRKDTALQLNDHNLYTITENSEYSDSNDVTSVDYDYSYPVREPITVTKRPENTPCIAVSFTDTCSCRNVRSACGTWQLPVCGSYRSFTLPDLMTHPHIPCYEASTEHTKHNHDWQHCKDKMLQTSPESYMQNAKERTCMVRKKSIQTTTETGSNTYIRRCSQNAAILYETKRTCKQCNITFTHSYSSDDSTKFLPAQSTKTEGTQYDSTNFPVDVGTQTGITQEPSIWCSTLLGAYPKLLQLPNPTLHLDNYTAILIPGHISQPIIMQPVHWCSSKPSETVAVQTDENREQRSTNENVWCNVKSQLGDKMQGSGAQRDVPHSQGRAGMKSSSIYQSAHSQSTSQQMTKRLIIPESYSEGSHTDKADSSTSTSALLDLDDFSDDEDIPCLPTTTVTPTKKTEDSGNQQWTDINNLILGTGRNVFPYNITMQEKNCSVQETKDTKKKCVSWSDLSGHGALHTEMVFASDHNLFDSSQVSFSKITKNSLFNVISTKPWRRTTERYEHYFCGVRMESLKHSTCVQHLILPILFLYLRLRNHVFNSTKNLVLL